ncbi:aldo/keto reductase [uncultured Sphingobacterium sp.]|uniref:aldo/keto reductase n=1 Tax=uncultured Sphingobacterium sp. TaxID=182688 RepID=UPI00374A54F8
MEYTFLGRSGLRVSRLALGTMNFGYVSDEAESFKIMDAAVDAGINLFDSADVYGGPQKPDMVQGYGISEEIIGKWLRKQGSRGKIVLATKVYQPMGTGINDKYLSAYHIRKACEDSLRRLQTDHIDLYQMHHIDRNTPWEEIWQAMEVLVQQGKISYIGSCNFAGWHIAMAQAAAGSRHFMGLVSEQSIYNLSKRTIELEVIPACEKLGLGIMPWSPFAGGLLSGVLKKGIHTKRAAETREMVEKFRPQLEAYEKLCDEIGQEPTQVALAWLLHNPTITAPILGPRTIEQLTTNVLSLDIRLSEETLKELNTIWPGPGGAAPEAYAW